MSAHPLAGQPAPKDLLIDVNKLEEAFYASKPDPSDPKLAHLDGLNLSRAWMLEGIMSALPKGDPRRPALAAAVEAHRRAGLAAVTGAHYEGGHWLGSFAVYLTTQRGIGEDVKSLHRYIGLGRSVAQPSRCNDVTM